MPRGQSEILKKIIAKAKKLRSEDEKRGMKKKWTEYVKLASKNVYKK